MGVRWLVNACLLALPVGTTVGILLGVDSGRRATGQAPLFNGGDGSGTLPNDNRITTKQYCEKEVSIPAPSEGVQYSLNPNQWGVTEGETGALCMNVSIYDNGTYPTDTTAPAFSVTWQYPPGPETQPVHAFPNVQLEGGHIPAQLESIQNINLAMEWTYGVGDESAATTDVTALTQNLVNANVAIDMFLDNNKDNAQDSTKAAYEIMVWFAEFGTAAQPIGLEGGAVMHKTQNGTTFNLYAGKNGLKQTVLTWLASEPTEKFTGDIGPLLDMISSSGNTTWPTGSAYLGHLGMGTEAFSSNVNVTFNLPVWSVDVVLQ